MTNRHSSVISADMVFSKIVTTNSEHYHSKVGIYVRKCYLQWSYAEI